MSVSLAIALPVPQNVDEVMIIATIVHVPLIIDAESSLRVARALSMPGPWKTTNTLTPVIHLMPVSPVSKTMHPRTL